MALRGFEDSPEPVLISIDDFGLGTGPFPIDPTLAEFTDFGILCNVGSDRYFIPWGRVRAIRQTQVAQPVGTPAMPTSPGGSS